VRIFCVLRGITISRRTLHFASDPARFAAIVLVRQPGQRIGDWNAPSVGSAGGVVSFRPGAIWCGYFQKAVEQHTQFEERLYFRVPNSMQRNSNQRRLDVSQELTLGVDANEGDWMRAILAGMSDGILRTNAAREVIFLNRAAEELTGWKQVDAMGQPLQTIFRIEIVRDLFINSDGSPSKPLADAGEQALLVSRHGKESLITQRTTLLHDEAGAISGSVVMIRDITGQFQAIQNQECTLEELRHANQNLKQFSYSATHDLQEPLRMIAIYSQLLSRKLGQGADEEAAEYLSYMIQGALRMEAFVRALGAYTGAGAAENTSPLEPVDCKSVLDAALASLEPMIEDSGAQIAVGALPVIQAHPIQILQLFQNLVSNAIGYCGEQPPRVEISAIRHHQEWEFSVSDRGIGIPARYHSQVFGIFKRLDARGPSARTGIGLAICKRIVERYRGRIWVESAEGRGAVFYFTIPVVNPADNSGGTSA
jgi:PAS domain S-box-containing protein